MHLRKIGVVLLALLLAAMAMIPYVSAEFQNQNQISSDDTGTPGVASSEIFEANYISVETAKKHATVTMLDYVANGLVDENWVGATIDPNPIVIYDINGKKLYYQFSVMKEEKKIGEILTAVNKVLGVSVQRIGDPSVYDLETVKKKAESLVKTKNQNLKIISSKIVCYSYPKMGIMITLENPKNNEKTRIIVDALDESIVPEKDSSTNGDSGAESIYDKIPATQISQNIASWQDFDTYVSEVAAKLSSTDSVLIQPISREKIQSLKTKGVLYSSSAPNANYITPFPTTTQEKTQWCRIATAWLITKFYYPSTTRTQTTIANYMGVPSNSNTQPAADNEMRYYLDAYPTGGLGKSSSVSSYYLGQPASYFNLIKGEVDSNRPIKIGVNGHSRACIGYFKYTTGRITYKFSDPNTNSLYWEDSLAYNNYIAVRG